jgi:prepilin-type N-terminal cleavage/methylation domain-containing protein
MQKLSFSFKKPLSAFSLIELMAVVAIIGILASVAVPMFSKYLKKSKTSEAKMNIRKIYDGEIAYYQDEHTLEDGSLATKQFVSFSMTPSTIPGKNKVSGDFDLGNWSVIKFSVDSPVLYSYSVSAEGEASLASFTARAQGDVDGDGTTSLFERVGKVNDAGDIEGGAEVFMLDDLE